MAEIVLGGCLSHSPLLNIEPPAAARRPIAAYRAAATDLGARLRAARPDAVVIFAQDHFRTLFYDNMPQFLIGKAPFYDANYYNEEREFGLPRMVLKGHEELSAYLLRAGLDAGERDAAGGHRLHPREPRACYRNRR